MIDNERRQVGRWGPDPMRRLGYTAKLLIGNEIARRIAQRRFVIHRRSDGCVCIALDIDGWYAPGWLSAREERELLELWRDELEDALIVPNREVQL